MAHVIWSDAAIRQIDDIFAYIELFNPAAALLAAVGPKMLIGMQPGFDARLWQTMLPDVSVTASSAASRRW